MNWAMLITLAIQESLPVALKLAEKWATKKDQPATPAELAELKELSERTPATQMTAALSRAGIAADSEEGKRLLSLVAPQDPSVNVPAGGT